VPAAYRITYPGATVTGITVIGQPMLVATAGAVVTDAQTSEQVGTQPPRGEASGRPVRRSKARRSRTASFRPWVRLAVQPALNIPRQLIRDGHGDDALALLKPSATAAGPD
jgi:hypothetical protein